MLNQDAQQSNPLGPLTRAAQQVQPLAGNSIKAPVRNPISAAIQDGAGSTDPDTDGRRSYSPAYGSAFNVRQPEPKTPAAGNPLAEVRNSPAESSIAAMNPLAAAKPIASTGAAISTNGSSTDGVVAAASTANPMARAGEEFATMDMKGVNAIMARENQTRAEMIDNSIRANGGNGVAINSDGGIEAANAEKTARWRQDELLAQAMRGNQVAVSAALHANAQTQSEAGRNVMAEQVNADRNALTMRGQDMNARTAEARLAGNPLVQELNRAKIEGAKLNNEQEQRLGDLQQQLIGETDPGKRAEIAGQIKALSGKSGQAGQGDTLTMPQRRTNAEIDAARKAVSALTPEEIKRKTANFTATGRENPEYDPMMAKAVSLAGRRMYGEDSDFDQRHPQGPASQAAGSDGDAMTRFRADKAMQGHKTGQMTGQGLEVFDASGRLVGHYR